MVSKQTAVMALRRAQALLRERGPTDETLLDCATRIARGAGTAQAAIQLALAAFDPQDEIVTEPSPAEAERMGVRL